LRGALGSFNAGQHAEMVGLTLPIIHVPVYRTRPVKPSFIVESHE